LPYNGLYSAFPNTANAGIVKKLQENLLHNFFAVAKLPLTALTLKSLLQQQISSETNQLL